MRLIDEKTKQEVEAKLKNMGDYVKIDYLSRAMSSGLDYETRKFVMINLSRLYESKAMYAEAARLIKNAAEINTTSKNKISDFMKSVELYIKAGNYTDADYVLAQALALATLREKMDLKNSAKNYYLQEAKNYVKVDKRSLAKKAYEKLLTMELSAQEKKDVKQQLLGLYEKLGNVKEYFRMRDNLK